MTKDERDWYNMGNFLYSLQWSARMLLFHEQKYNAAVLRQDTDAEAKCLYDIERDKQLIAANRNQILDLFGSHITSPKPHNVS